MKKPSANKRGTDLPAELPAGFFKGAARGKYRDEYMAGQSSVRMVPLEPDVADEFTTADEVNAALRLVKQIRQGGRSAKRKKTA